MCGPDRRRELIPYAAVLGGLAALIWGPGPVAVGLGSLLFLVGAWWRPLAGATGIAASLPCYLFARQVGGFALSPPEIGLGLTLAAVAARAIAAPRQLTGGTPLARSSPYDAPIALLLLAALLSLLVTEYLRLSLRELRTLVVEPVAFFYLVRALVRHSGDAWIVVGGLVASATLVALVGIGQWFVGGAVTEAHGVRRVLGTYMSPNHFGLLLGRALPFLLAAAWLAPRWRAPTAVSTIVCGVALALTFSLGAWMGTAVGALAVVALAGGRRALAVACAAAVILVASALVAVRVERVAERLDPTQGTALVRLQLWEASAAMLHESPLLGIGLDNFLYRYPAYLPTGTLLEPNLSHPHNLVLHFWLQLGLLGAVAASWLLWHFFRRVWPIAGGGGPLAERALAVGCIGSMVDFVVHGLVDNSYFLVDMAFIFWLTLAVGGAGSRAGSRSAEC